MDWTYWLLVSILLISNAMWAVVEVKRSQCKPVLRSDVELRLETLRYLTAKERSDAERALTGMTAGRYWFLIELLDDIEEGHRAASLLHFEALRWESDASLAS